jgi:hypothetical protein
MTPGSARTALRKSLFPHILLALAGLCAVLTGCAAPRTPLPDSGVEGYVKIGPTCPVLRLDDPCPDKPYHASLLILHPDGREIRTIETNADGFFRLSLPPGEYLLRPVTSGAFPLAADTHFTVKAGEYTRLSITYDSGIR